MNEKQKTIAELQAELLAEKQKNSQLEERIAELEAINLRLKTRVRPAVRQGATRVNFGG
jgi:hypothetical protein